MKLIWENVVLMLFQFRKSSVFNVGIKRRLVHANTEYNPHWQVLNALPYCILCLSLPGVLCTILWESCNALNCMTKLLYITCERKCECNNSPERKRKRSLATKDVASHAQKSIQIKAIGGPQLLPAFQLCVCFMREQKKSSVLQLRWKAFMTFFYSQDIHAKENVTVNSCQIYQSSSVYIRYAQNGVMIVPKFGTGRSRKCIDRCIYSQLFVSLATAIIPIGWCGISARRTLVSLPVYLLDRSTDLRVQSDQ